MEMHSCYYLGYFLIPGDSVRSTVSPWTCHYFPYNGNKISYVNNKYKQIRKLNTSEINHEVESKTVMAIIDKFKRLIHQTDRTDINANLKILGI